MNSLGWSRREQQPANTNKQNPILGTLQKLNPFGSEGNVRLPTHEGEGPGAPLPARTRREEEEAWFARKSQTPTSTSESLRRRPSIAGATCVCYAKAWGGRSYVLGWDTAAAQS